MSTRIGVSFFYAQSGVVFLVSTPPLATPGPDSGQSIFNVEGKVLNIHG